MHSSGSVRIDEVGRVGWVYIRWPESHNVDSSIIDGLRSVLDAVEDTQTYRALVLVEDSARGDDDSQHDVSTPRSAPYDLEMLRSWEKLIVRLDRLPCATVAAIGGVCTGSWLQLALACDHRIASDSATFQVVELKDGMLPGMNVFRLAKFMGLGTARNLIFTGRRLDTPEAIRLGIVDERCEDTRLADTTRRFLQVLEPSHGVALQLARRLLNESFHAAFEDLIGHYLASQHRCASELDKLRSEGA